MAILRVADTLNTVVGPMWVNKAEGKKCLSGMDASIRE